MAFCALLGVLSFIDVLNVNHLLLVQMNRVFWFVLFIYVCWCLCCAKEDIIEWVPSLQEANSPQGS